MSGVGIARAALRMVITGGPRTGKTTLAEKCGLAEQIRVRHTDDLLGVHDWSGVSDEVSTWFDVPGPWVVEGVACPRALRKWLARHPHGRPCDVVLWMGTPKVILTRGQEAMARGCDTVWQEIASELVIRGVEVAHE